MSSFKKNEIVYFVLNSELKPGKVIEQNDNSTVTLLSYAGKPIQVDVKLNKVYRDYDSAISKLSSRNIIIDPEIIEIVQYLKLQ